VSPRHRAGEPASGLSRREAEVLRLLGERLGVRAIAERLGIQEPTVRGHLRTALAKLERWYGRGGAPSPGGRSLAAQPEAMDRLLRRALRAAAHLAEPVSGLLFELPVPARSGAEELVERLRAAARTSDLVGPWAGQSVLVVLPHTNLAGAHAAAARLSAACRGAQPAVGAAEWDPGEDPEAFAARLASALRADVLRREVERCLAVRSAQATDPR
jgi:DNA-binding CsgD family transcriptional regulator